MSAVPQQVFVNHKASVDNFLAFQEAVFNGFEKLVDLNLKVARASLDEAAQKTQEEMQQMAAEKSILKVTEFVTANDLATLMNIPVIKVN